MVRETQSGTAWISPITFRTTANVAEYTDTPGVGTFHYKVRAVNTVTGLQSAYTPWTPVTIVGTPAIPTGLAASDLGTRKALVSWVDNSINESGFQVSGRRRSCRVRRR